MKDNKLIAEFMGVPQGEHTHFMVEPFALESYADVDDLKYDISWDWLMPVVKKCKESQIFGTQNLIDDIDFTLVNVSLSYTYQAVVEFIKIYNDDEQ
jgi:hypothetical protein